MRVPKTPPPNTRTLEVRVSTYQFRGDANIQPTACCHFIPLPLVMLGREELLGVTLFEGERMLTWESGPQGPA